MYKSHINAPIKYPHTYSFASPRANTMKTKTQSILPTLSSKNIIRLGHRNQVRFQKFMSYGSNV